MAVISMTRADDAMTVDGNGQSVDLSSLSSDVHAIQWDGSTGHIEYNDGRLNETIDSIDDYQSYIDAHASAKAAEDAEKAATVQAEQDASDAREAQEATYGWKRIQDYPSIGNQLDSLFHAGVFPEDMEAEIQAVKDNHPKE